MVCQNKIIGPATESLSDVCHKIYRGHGPSEPRERPAGCPPISRAHVRGPRDFRPNLYVLTSYQRSTIRQKYHKKQASWYVMNITRRPPQGLERQGRTGGYSYQRDCIKRNTHPFLFLELFSIFSTPTTAPDLLSNAGAPPRVYTEAVRQTVRLELGWKGGRALRKRRPRSRLERRSTPTRASTCWK